MFRQIRILVLLLILLAVVVNANITRTDATDWWNPLVISVYPLNGDGSEATQRYISQLDAADFRSIETFMARELKRYNIPLEYPFKIYLQPEIVDLPPRVVENSSMFDVMWWSLMMRYWSYQIGKFDSSEPDIQMFVFFHDPETHDRLDHSVGLEKGMMGFVNVFANREMRESNNFVITHEILHTLGATDKYEFASGQPHYPDGFSEPHRQPLYPQRFVEIMGGRLALSPTTAMIPTNLRQTMIGSKTASEIGLLSYREL